MLIKAFVIRSKLSFSFIIISSTCPHYTKELQHHHTMASSTPIRAAYLSGNYATTMNFSSAAKYTKWHHDMMAIKDNIASINTTWAPEPRFSHYQNQRIPMAEAFEQKLGSDYVPADFKSSLDEVKSSIPPPNPALCRLQRHAREEELFATLCRRNYEREQRNRQDPNLCFDQDTNRWVHVHPHIISI